MDNKKINKVLKELTIEEKAALCSGLNYWQTKPIARLEVPSGVMSDGPHGVRKEKADDDNIALKASYPSTCFPTASCSACSWNPDLLYEMGVALAEECKDQNVGTVLGPGVNMKRTSICGRNFEYFSEDPYLAGQLGIKYVQGVQSTGVGTSLKHFAANNQEYLRMTISSVIDKRALHEIYLRAFEDIVKAAQPTTIMCSYNKINGVYSSDNKELLTDILRTKWGFKGLVMSDWGATNDRVAGIKAGMDLEMPYFGVYHDNLVSQAVKNKDLREEELDTCVSRVLNFAYDGAAATKEEFVADYKKHHALARKIAGESIILMKNLDNLLPLNKEEDLVVIGELANTMRYQGSGSSRINPYNLVNFLKYLDDSKIKYTFAKGYDLSDKGYNQNLIDEAIRIASKKSKVIIFAGLTDSYESEGYDRKEFNIPDGHTSLINAVSQVNPNVTVVLLGGSPYNMPWIDKVQAIINAYLPGEAGAEAIGDVLFGDVNPSGKLAET
jgi:beta-glucosidase